MTFNVYLLGVPTMLFCYAENAGAFMTSETIRVCGGLPLAEVVKGPSP
jgi:hypothetical protein